MGKQEQTFGRSVTTLTTVVRFAVSHSIRAPIGPPVDTQALSSFQYPDPLSTHLVPLSSTLLPSPVAHPPLFLPYSLQVSPS